ncbi:hypothetical protein MKEN_00842000 [Mycena kentingensis (nom. inval.)]|nr:hypothetical protein MKEN_00842000 [Mycena kentingensis (nom. inval.)]
MSRSSIRRKRHSTQFNPRAGKRPRTENEPPEPQSQSRRESQSPSPDPDDATQPEIRQGMDADELYQIAQQLKAQVQDLRRSQQETARDALGDVTNREDSNPECEDEVEREEISFIWALGKKFSYTKVLWIPVDLEDDIFKADVDDSYNPLERFDIDLDSQPFPWVQGVIRDLLDAIPEEYHAGDELQGWVREQILKGAATHRSDTATRLRGNPTWFGRSVQNFATSASREEFRPDIGYREDPEEPGTFYYDAFKAPLLFADHDVEDETKLFLSDELFTVHTAITNGPAAAKALVTNTKAPKVGSIGRQWGLQKTTPGMISAAAIYLRWVHSRDDEFHGFGDVTKHNWDEDYDAYMNWFTVGLASADEIVLNVLRVWDEKFYPHSRERAQNSQELIPRYSLPPLAPLSTLAVLALSASLPTHPHPLIPVQLTSPSAVIAPDHRGSAPPRSTLI